MLDRLLAGTLPDPDGGPTLSVPVRAVTIARSLAGREASLVAGLGLGDRPAVVCDAPTLSVLAKRVHQSLGGNTGLIVLPGTPSPEMETVEAVRAQTKQATGLIAVGSGTINDLCKYATFRDRKPYAVFGTAPSMNGYTSVSAAITEHGHKKSLPAHAPVGVFLDLEILAKAPLRMIRSGLGDSACRSTAQADWLLAHLLFERPYRTAPFELLEVDEAALFAKAGELVAGDISAMEVLARTLVLSGLGMTICGGSYPASQGEHLISHYIDMLGDPSWPASFHGEHIAVTTLTMARLQEAMLGDAPPAVSVTPVSEQTVIAHFGPELGASCWQAFAKKRLDADAARECSRRIRRAC